MKYNSLNVLCRLCLSRRAASTLQQRAQPRWQLECSLAQVQTNARARTVLLFISLKLARCYN